MFVEIYGVVELGEEKIDHWLREDRVPDRDDLS